MVDGVIQRIDTAREFVPQLGIATECGIARAQTGGCAPDSRNLRRRVARPVVKSMQFRRRP